MEMVGFASSKSQTKLLDDLFMGLSTKVAQGIAFLQPAKAKREQIIKQFPLEEECTSEMLRVFLFGIIQKKHISHRIHASMYGMFADIWLVLW